MNSVDLFLVSAISAAGGLITMLLVDLHEIKERLDVLERCLDNLIDAYITKL